MVCFALLSPVSPLASAYCEREVQDHASPSVPLRNHGQRRHLEVLGSYLFEIFPRNDAGVASFHLVGYVLLNRRYQFFGSG
jgi:hypothetical protein